MVKAIPSETCSFDGCPPACKGKLLSECVRYVSSADGQPLSKGNSAACATSTVNTRKPPHPANASAFWRSMPFAVTACNKAITNDTWPCVRDKVMDLFREDSFTNEQLSVNGTVLSLAPTQESIRQRDVAIDYIRDAVREYFGLEYQVRLTGSYPLRTFLSMSDVNIILVRVDANQCILPIGSNEIQDFHAQLCGTAILDASTFASGATLRSVTLIAAKTPRIRAVINNITVDVGLGHIEAYQSVAFLDMASRAIRHDHLLKRSFLLIKSWSLTG